MNLEAYIASGILEAYVLGELSVREREQVELQLENHPALRDEVQRIEKTFEQLALKTAVTPPSAVKTKLLSSVNLKLTPPSAKANNVWQWLAAASIVIACGFALLAYTYYSQWNSASQQLADLELQNQQIAQSMNTVNLELSKIQADVAVLDNPQFARVTLAGTDQAPDAYATVYWNKSTAEVYLRIQNLKALTEENQFQLWALIDGKPVDMGVFDHDKGLIKMKTTLTADAFAVTIEKRGGSLVPALNTLQVMGSTKS
jgi:anti-sigma-K factor RskA